MEQWLDLKRKLRCRLVAQDLETTLTVIDDEMSILDQTPRFVVWDVGLRVRMLIHGVDTVWRTVSLKFARHHGRVAIDADDIGSAGAAFLCKWLSSRS